MRRSRGWNSKGVRPVSELVYKDRISRDEVRKLLIRKSFSIRNFVQYICDSCHQSEAAPESLSSAFSVFFAVDLSCPYLFSGLLCSYSVVRDCLTFTMHRRTGSSAQQHCTHAKSDANACLPRMSRLCMMSSKCHAISPATVSYFFHWLVYPCLDTSNLSSGP